MRNKRNSKRDSFLSRVSVCDIESSNIGEKCSFNFSYFSPAKGGQDWPHWAAQTGACSLDSLMSKLVSYTEQPLSYWENQRVGGGGLKVLSYYHSFPSHSTFQLPPCVPHDVSWGRFRLGNKIRLAGFSIPRKMDGLTDSKGHRLNSNIFYIVFLDKDHQFWPTGEAD